MIAMLATRNGGIADATRMVHMRAEARALRRWQAEELARRAMESCPLRPVDRGPGACAGCGEAVEGRRRKWCSDKCANRWWVAHSWTSARWEAIRRSSGFTADQLRDMGSALYSMAFCDQCGAYTSSPEVNHVDPRNGLGYGAGCHNHQTNLQVLYHACHAAVTADQARMRLGIPEGGRPAEPKRPPGSRLADRAGS